MVNEFSAMALVFSQKNGTVCLLQAYDGKWVFPKGHVTSSESSIKAACRETREEAGVIINPHDCFAVIDGFSYCFLKVGIPVKKRVAVFAFSIPEATKIFTQEREFFGGGWFYYDTAISIITYDDEREAFKKAYSEFMRQLDVY
ncbi:MAG: NUDIX domain-containing protein [Clostridia bacterium]|nr:NUDIX domain-containing protein [Clostridia bacterium]